MFSARISVLRSSTFNPWGCLTSAATFTARANWSFAAAIHISIRRLRFHPFHGGEFLQHATLNPGASGALPNDAAYRARGAASAVNGTPTQIRSRRQNFEFSVKPCRRAGTI
jgi:hypothetical protein